MNSELIWNKFNGLGTTEKERIILVDRIFVDRANKLGINRENILHFCRVPVPVKKSLPLMNWSHFNLIDVINEDTRTKHLALHLKHKENDENAVFLLNKLPFNPSDSLDQLTSGLQAVDVNDIYHRFMNEANGVEAKLIYPATSAHLKKYSEQSRRLVLETPAMHHSITRPHFQALRDAGQIGWIENILADESEMERRLVDKKCQQSGYILLPDYKWTDETNVSGLYLLAIPRRKDLWSVRDLKSEHLPLLKDIKSDIMSLFSPEHAKYKYSDGSPVLYDHLRVYFHYPPTYPHLHIHVTLASSQAACAAGQAILLDEVIDNLENICRDYYTHKRTIPMEFGDQNDLYLKLKSQQAQ